MNDREAIAAAKTYVSDVYADERIGNPRLEEFEHILSAGNWVVTLSFPRPWDTPRTRAQEVLENLGAASPLQRLYKVVTIAENGTVLSIKNRAYPAAAE